MRQRSAYTATPAVWFPAVRVGTGVDVFTEQLCSALNVAGIRAEVTWLPARAEYLPWTVSLPPAPSWATLVHVNTWLHQRFVPPSLPVVATMHLCVHDPALQPYKSRLQKIYHRLWVRRVESHCLQRSARLVAVSQYTADRTADAFGLARNDITVVHNGVQVEALDERLLSSDVVDRPFRLLYVGNWSSRKGVDLLAPIMGMLGAGFELLYTADSRGADASASLPANCRCIGRVPSEEMKGVYRSADALIFPSRLEGLPLTVLEAMAAGLPVVTSNSASLPEIVEDGKTGYLCKTDQPAEYVAAVRRLAVSQERRTQLAGAARHAVQQRFSISEMARAYVSLYQDVLQHSEQVDGS